MTEKLSCKGKRLVDPNSNWVTVSKNYVLYWASTEASGPGPVEVDCTNKKQNHAFLPTALSNFLQKALWEGGSLSRNIIANMVYFDTCIPEMRGDNVH